MLSARSVPPGGEAQIKVTVHTEGRHGALAKGIEVLSNDPKTPRFALQMVGKVRPLARLEPERWHLKVLPKSMSTKRVQLVGTRVAELQLSDLTVRGAGVSAKVVTSPGAPPELEVSFRAPEKAGRFSGSVRVQTNLKKAPRLWFYLWGEVIEPQANQGPQGAERSAGRR